MWKMQHRRPGLLFLELFTYHRIVLRVQAILIRIRIMLLILIQISDCLIWIRILIVTKRYGIVPKTVLFMHLNLIFLVSRSDKTQREGKLC
jgi:hypothetical protein